VSNNGDNGTVEKLYPIVPTNIYNGEALQSGTTYYWKVKVWDESGTDLPGKQTCTLVDGLLKFFKFGKGFL